MALKVRPERFEFEDLLRSSEWMVVSDGSLLSSENVECCGRQWGPTGRGGTCTARSVCLVFRVRGLTMSMRGGGHLGGGWPASGRQ